MSVEEVFSSENLYCPDEEAFREMREVMEDARKSRDSVGGIVEAVARNVPAGLGGPYEEDIEADLASAFFRIPAVRGWSSVWASGLGSSMEARPTTPSS